MIASGCLRHHVEPTTVFENIVQLVERTAVIASPHDVAPTFVADLCRWRLLSGAVISCEHQRRRAHYQHPSHLILSSA